MLTDKITEGLKDLNFLDVQFQITFRRRKEYTAGGFDDIEYEISTNPGESLKPLGKIVSGGELSRIMLAIKAILADRDQIETLIFDEMDTETITEIHPLEGDDSVRELARLLGGAEITQAVFDNAKEMKELAQVHKNTRLK